MGVCVRLRETHFRNHKAAKDLRSTKVVSPVKMAETSSPGTPFGGMAAWGWSGSVTSCIPMGYTARTSPPRAFFSWRDGGQGAGLGSGGRGWQLGKLP
jgi:hypothetical protein